MDIVDTFLGLGATTLFIGAVLLGLVGWKFFNLGLGKNTLTIVKVAALLFAVGGLVASGWLATDAGTETIAPEAPVEWGVTATESLTHVIAVSENHYQVQCEFNTTTGNTFNNETGWCLFNFTVARLDTNPDWAATTAEVTDVGDYTSTTTGITYSGAAKDSNGEYEIYWNKSSGASDRVQTTVPRNTDYRDDYVTLYIEANPACFDAMVQYRTVSMIVEIGGETFTIDWYYMTVGT